MLFALLSLGWHHTPSIERATIISSQRFGSPLDLIPSKLHHTINCFHNTSTLVKTGLLSNQLQYKTTVDILTKMKDNTDIG